MQRTLCLAALIAAIGLTLQGCGGGGDSPTPAPGGDNSLVDVAEKESDLSTLVTAIKAADLGGTLSGKGPFTIFAPSNAAFSAVPAPLLTYLLNNKDALTKVLEYHVASGTILSTDLKNGEKIKTLEGADVNVTIKDNKTVMINEATATKADVTASNGVLHIINQVLIPPGFTAPTIPEVAVSAGLSTLVTAVKAADLASTLSGTGPFTVFAPTNDAFKNLPKGVLDELLKPANKQLLVKLLEYHVVSGEVVAADLKNGERVKTLEGQDVNVTISGSTVSINTAKVTQADVYASNGVVHVIDAVLIPPGFVPPPPPPPSGICTPIAEDCENGVNLGDPTAADTAEDCCNRCEKYNEGGVVCGAWTWNSNKPGPYAKFCYLHKDCKVTKDDPDALSGVSNATRASYDHTFVL